MGERGRGFAGFLHILDEGRIVVAVTRRPKEFPIADPALTVVGSDVHDKVAVAKAAVFVSTIENTPTMRQWMRREFAKGA